MTDFLKHLTEEDRAKLRAGATMVSYEPEAVIVEQGSELHAILILCGGVAREFTLPSGAPSLRPEIRQQASPRRQCDRRNIQPSRTDMGR